MRNRILGLAKERLPVLIGTLGEGPSCIPPGSHLLSFGPVFDTDVLSWDLQKDASAITPGRCEPGVWNFCDDKQGENEWDELLDELFPAPILLWERWFAQLIEDSPDWLITSDRTNRNGHCCSRGSCQSSLLAKETWVRYGQTLERRVPSSRDE